MGETCCPSCGVQCGQAVKRFDWVECMCAQGPTARLSQPSGGCEIPRSSLHTTYQVLDEGPVDVHWLQLEVLKEETLHRLTPALQLLWLNNSSLGCLH